MPIYIDTILSSLKMTDSLKIAISPCRSRDFAYHVRNCFIKNEQLSEIIISEGGKCLSIIRNDALSKRYFEWLKKNWR